MSNHNHRPDPKHPAGASRKPGRAKRQLISRSEAQALGLPGFALRWLDRRYLRVATIQTLPQRWHD